MTYLALNLSQYVNGVAKKHGEISQHMFARYVIDSITNGIHIATWASQAFQKLFDHDIPGWRNDNLSLRYELGIPKRDIWQAHMICKKNLTELVNGNGARNFDDHIFTIGFGRRATVYKQADLLISVPFGDG